jgi:hypothetical protein
MKFIAYRDCAGLFAFAFVNFERVTSYIGGRELQQVTNAQACFDCQPEYLPLCDVQITSDRVCFGVGDSFRAIYKAASFLRKFVTL